MKRLTKYSFKRKEKQNADEQIHAYGRHVLRTAVFGEFDGKRSGASYGLGDRITVRLESVNVSERSIQASPVVYTHADDRDPRAGIEPVHDRGARKPRRKDKDTSLST